MNKKENEKTDILNWLIVGLVLLMGLLTLTFIFLNIYLIFYVIPSEVWVQLWEGIVRCLSGH